MNYLFYIISLFLYAELKSSKQSALARSELTAKSHLSKSKKKSKLSKGKGKGKKSSSLSKKKSSNKNKLSEDKSADDADMDSGSGMENSGLSAGADKEKDKKEKEKKKEDGKESKLLQGASEANAEIPEKSFFFNSNGGLETSKLRSVNLLSDAMGPSSH